MNLLLVTDAWEPQVSGVVRTINTTITHLKNLGYNIKVIHPELFGTVPLPVYKEIRTPWPIPTDTEIATLIDAFKPDHVHIFTEGVLGLLVQKYVQRNNVSVTTSYHTDFPKYLKKYLHIPEWLTYRLLKNFHNRTGITMVNTKAIKDKLESKGFKNLHYWGRGVDTSVFKPGERTLNKIPVLLYVGRVAKEKNLEAFLELPDIYEKRVVGNGPELQTLKEQYPDVYFKGYRFGNALADEYRAADCFVFPSKSDTFGMVMIEAAACGTPVAAYPVQGPIDVVEEGKIGYLHEDLLMAVSKAIMLDRNDVANYAKKYSWEDCTEQFIGNIYASKEYYKSK